jgi:hypothetical protein
MVGFELEFIIRFASPSRPFIIVVSTVLLFVILPGKRRNESTYGGFRPGTYYSVFRISRNSILLTSAEPSSSSEAFR